MTLNYKDFSSKCKIEYNVENINDKIEFKKCEINHDLTECNKKFENLIFLKQIQLLSKYNFLFIVYNKKLGIKTILKIQINQSSSSENEMKINCLVSDIPNFIKTYDYWLCDIQPDSLKWKRSIAKEKIDNNLKYSKDRENSLSYIEMEYCEGTLVDLLNDKIPWTDYDIYSIFFELLYGYNIAIQELGFSHGDAHLNNIFYQFDKKPREYDIIQKNENIKDKKRKKYVISCKSLISPKWADFGMSHINYYGEIIPIIFFQMERFGIKIDISLQNEIQSKEQLLLWLAEKVEEYDSKKKQRTKENKEVFVYY